MAYEPRVKCPANCNQGWARVPVEGKPFPKYSRQVKCPRCDGKGTIPGLTPTSRPRGTPDRPVPTHRPGRPSLTCSVPGTCNCTAGCDQPGVPHCRNHEEGCHLRCANR